MDENFDALEAIEFDANDWHAWRDVTLDSIQDYCFTSHRWLLASLDASQVKLTTSLVSIENKYFNTLKLSYKGVLVFEAHFQLGSSYKQRINCLLRGYVRHFLAENQG